MRSTPCERTSETMCSMQGLPATITIGLGWFEVSGRSRVPSPPAITTAFMLVLSPRGIRRSPVARFLRPSSLDLV